MGIILQDGSRVGIVGGGPAGSLTAYFLLTFAQRVGLDLGVDIYEPRDFTSPGPGGCNMCGGIVSESLVQALALEGIDLPSTVVQRGIDSYVLHTDQDDLRIETPLGEKRIAAVHRGGGPRDVQVVKWGGLDGHLLSLAQERGAKVVAARVTEVGWDDGRPQVRLKTAARSYDLVVGATGVNSTGWQLFEQLGLRAKRPQTTKAYITELGLGAEAITQFFGSSMHVFLLDNPRLDCAAIVPKGDYVTVCLLGRDIDRELVTAFFESPAVRRCFPKGWHVEEGACHCSPKINIREATRPFADRVVLVGDCGVTRLYKDGIGAAYRTAKAAARTAVFTGVSSRDFEEHYWPTYRALARDNAFGRLIFAVVHWVKMFRPFLRGTLAMAGREQLAPGPARRMSIVLWDTFTGSAPYREIFLRTLDPRFVGRFLWHSAWAWKGGPLATGGREGRSPGMDRGVLGREYLHGDVICRQGEPGDRMYVVQVGHVEVLREEGATEVVVGHLAAGDVFGEMAIVEQKPRSATVRAKGTARVLTLDKRAFLTRVHEDPSLAFRILEKMCARVRRLDEELARHELGQSPPRLTANSPDRTPQRRSGS